MGREKGSAHKFNVILSVFVILVYFQIPVKSQPLARQPIAVVIVLAPFFHIIIYLLGLKFSGWPWKRNPTFPGAGHNVTVLVQPGLAQVPFGRLTYVFGPMDLPCGLYLKIHDTADKGSPAGLDGFQWCQQ